MPDMEGLCHMDRDYISAPQVVNVSFDLQPVMIQIESLSLINQVDQLSGLGDWVVQTHATLTPAELRENQLVFEFVGIMFYHSHRPRPTHETLQDYCSWLSQQDVGNYFYQTMDHWLCKLRDHPDYWASAEPLPALDEIVSDLDTFIRFNESLSPDVSSGFDRDLLTEGFALLHRPTQLLERARRHMNFMWDNFLAEEWHNTLPMLKESIAAFSRMNLRDLTTYEAIRTVTGRDMRGRFDEEAERVERLIFIPSPHLGPYVARITEDKQMLLMYGARLPRADQQISSAFSRSELLIRMNALADDTRLHILEMLTKQEEMCAQDIIEALGLSQSSVSRHLSQLSATGFLLERRRDVNKCYSLNTDRIIDTVRALTNFLARQ